MSYHCQLERNTASGMFLKELLKFTDSYNDVIRVSARSSIDLIKVILKADIRIFVCLFIMHYTTTNFITK